MLKNLTIRNFAIITELELDFRSGLTVLTGETGAGKSILLGALNLVLGDRAETDSIHDSADCADIIAEFDITSQENVCAWLVEKELHADGECILRRRLSRDGRSRASVNGTPVTLPIIRELAEMLIDIHGQHAHQSMMKSRVQRQLLDSYAGHLERLKTVGNLYVEMKLLDEQYRALQQNSQERSDRLELLRFQTRELDELAPQADEYRVLDEKHRRLANIDSLRQDVGQALYQLDEDEQNGIQTTLARILNQLEQAGAMDPRLEPVNELLQNVQVYLGEAVSLLRDYRENLEIDPAEFAATESRLQDIIDLARKHRCPPETLHETHTRLKQELDDIDHSDERLDALERQREKVAAQYRHECTALGVSRRKAAGKLNREISRAMQKLGMAGGRFEVDIQTRPFEQATASGLDEITFTVTANSGQACKPIGKVASGGELARINLAMQMIMAKDARIPTLIFDEVDSGIGGGTAEIVGKQLRKLSENGQVICITHLPQVASQGHHHWRVEKHTKKRNTESRVIELDRKQRIEEIARMLSGVAITDQSLANAESLLDSH